MHYNYKLKISKHCRLILHLASYSFWVVILLQPDPSLTAIGEND